MERFVCRDGKRLRCGYTTGTCAALAAKAAAGYLLRGVWDQTPGILTPGGIFIQAGIEEARAGQTEAGGIFAECAVRKDAGDDYDVTDGLLIFVRAEFAEPVRRYFGAAEEKGRGAECACEAAGCQIQIEGGRGVGRVTRAGLDQPPGEAAINSGPRRMIEEAVTEVLRDCQETRPVRLTVSVPEGERAAANTFNPVLGITGGISILGTNGLVEPMSDEAMAETIRAQLGVLYAEGWRYAAAVPGKLGMGFLQGCLRRQGLKEPAARALGEQAVTVSNLIGRAVDLAGELGFEGLLLAGHIGKLVKLGNGIMNTHSREGDGRMDTLLSCALESGARLAVLKKIRAANTTNEAVELLRAEGLLKAVIVRLLERIGMYLKRRAVGSLRLGVLLFEQDGTVLGMDAGARFILKQLLRQDMTGGEDNEHKGEKISGDGPCGGG